MRPAAGCGSGMLPSCTSVRVSSPSVGTVVHFGNPAGFSTHSRNKISGTTSARLSSPAALLPLDRAGGFGGDVVDDAVDAAHLVDDAGGGAAEDLVREWVIVRGHAVGRGDSAERADEIVGARIAHDAD